MKQSMNVPYVKQFDKNGICTNPMSSYISEFDNRRKRRYRERPFYGQSKNYHLTIDGIFKYERFKQYETDKEGKGKVIEHYILK